MTAAHGMARPRSHLAFHRRFDTRFICHVVLLAGPHVLALMSSGIATEAPPLKEG
jgi:hypothetical protein